MNAEIIIIAAVGFAILSLWVWMNVLLMRKKPKKRTAQDTTMMVGEEQQPDTLFTSNHSDEESSVEIKQPSSASAEQANGERQALNDLEILHAHDHKPSKVFGGSGRPYRLNIANVPVYATTPWETCFYRLSEDPTVLGWIAFEDNVVGASDREYDAEFLEVLRNYRQSAEKLRKEVGLSNMIETSITGEEGRIWFLTAVEEHWFALFVDRAADIDALTDRLLAPVKAH